MHPLLSSSAVQGLLVLSSHSISIVLCEDRLIDGEYLDFGQRAGQLARDVPVIVVSQVFDEDERVTAIASGAFHYVRWPPDRLEFEYALLNAFHEHDRRHNLMAEKAARR
jgi:DNA-binding NtrC family response regulator